MMNFVFKPGHARFRATFSGADMGPSRLGKVEAAKGVLHDVQICLQGEAKGHGVFLDEDFIKEVVKQGNEFKNGCKVRFGHPAMCSDAIGTFVGMAKNFRAVPVARTDGQKALGAIADVYLAESAHDSPNGDVFAWLTKTAQTNPDTFGQSIVFTYSDVFVLDAKGGKHFYSKEVVGYTSSKERETKEDSWKKQSCDEHVYAALDKLLGSDFTDTPAATDGVFSADSLAAQAESLLVENPQIFDLLTSDGKAVAEFLSRYNEILKEAGKPSLCVCVSAERDAALAAKDEAEKRMAGLQAAKDKELAALKNDFTRQTAKLNECLVEMSALKEAKQKAEKDLALAGERLAAANEARAKLVGGALSLADSGVATWQQAVDKFGFAKAKKNYPELYAAIMKNADVK